VSSPRCTTCGRNSTLWSTSERLYRGRDYGPSWVCSGFPACQSWVGCHPDTDIPLGTIAGPELRAARMRAHAAFDPLWKAKFSRGYSKSAARGAGYRWLADALGIKVDDCHMALFDVQACERVIAICAPYLERLKK